jgi:uncharacterized membrane protein YdjX (TVP38/TMEM64 family)
MRTARMPPRDKLLSGLSTVAPRRLHRWLPLLLIVAAAAFVWLLGLHGYLSFTAIVENRQALREFVAQHLPLAIIIYALIYIASTALLVPGIALLTVLGGFLFGWALAGSLTVLAATLGATLLFLAARSSFGDVLARRGGSLIKRLSRNFADNAFSYLLFLRLVPLFPFFVVNIAPAFCNIKTRTFVLATLIGIVPGTFAYSVLGSGFDRLIESEYLAYRRCMEELAAEVCAFELHPAKLLSPEIMGALVLLALMALIPPLLRHLKSSRTGF